MTIALSKLWDELAERFNSHKTMRTIHKDVAVNLYVGWNTFFSQIKIQADYVGKRHLRILDFGSGTGAFCKELEKLGHTVVGMDHSEKMIELASRKSPKSITYVRNENHNDILAKGLEKFDVITAMHSFDWIDNIDDYLKQLGSLLTNEGLIIFAVFPKEHVIDSLRLKDQFEDFDSETNPKKGYLNFDGVKVPVFIKAPDYYDDLFKKMKFHKVLEFHPPFPKIFFEIYDWPGSKYPEMVILGYRKSA